MKTLIITAHPSSKGFTHSIARTIDSKSNNPTSESEIMNLYDNKYKQGYLSYEALNEIKKDDKVILIQKKIRWADELIFIFPIWW